MSGSALAVWEGPLPIENHQRGRDGNPIVVIVDHWMAATFDSALARFRDPASAVSAHYLIRRDGLIYQVVDEDDTAYHAGDWGWNLRSIGIEHEAAPTIVPSDALYAASAKLHRDIADRRRFALIVDLTLKPHNSIVATACPGTLDLDRIVREAEMDQATFDQMASSWAARVYGPALEAELVQRLAEADDAVTKAAVAAAVKAIAVKLSS